MEGKGRSTEVGGLVTLKTFVFLFFLPLVIGFKVLSMEMFRTKILFQKRKVFF